MNSYFVKALRIATAFLVLVCLSFSFCGCFSYLKLKIEEKQGKYPTDNDFPNTRWCCRELDLVLDMIENCGTYGFYSENGKQYRVYAGFLKGKSHLLDFYLYSSAEVTASDYDPSLVHYDQINAGSICTSYYYEKDSGTIVCSVSSCNLADGEMIPETLTFEQTGLIAQTPKTRWVAEGLDLYLDSYSDIEGYYKGEIMLDGEKRVIQAVEVGNDHFFMLLDERSHLPYMWFEISEDWIVATATDYMRYNDQAYRMYFRDWYDNYKDVKTITFHPASVE